MHRELSRNCLGHQATLAKGVCRRMHDACGCAGASLACTTNMGEDVAVGDGVYVSSCDGHGDGPMDAALIVDVAGGVVVQRAGNY
jgi:hypothetical protein